MTRDELKAELTTIVCDLTLTKEQRSDKLGSIAATWMKDFNENELDMAFNQWNNVMVEIVIENNLGRQ